MDRQFIGKKAEEFVDILLTPEALDQPSDTVKPEHLELELPKWFDEKKFNQGRRFYWDNCFGLTTSQLIGLVAVFSIPSILAVLAGSRRSNSIYTAYKRYLSTMLHIFSWFEHELKPNSTSWRSLFAVRSRHLRAGLASKLKGGPTVSQRDIALTQFGLFAFATLKPDKFGVAQVQPGDWDAYNHFWKVIGHMLGLEDRYNLCRENMDETRQVCQLVMDRVYTPCLENAPEYFEHLSHVMLEGMWYINPTIETTAIMYQTRYLADVPGYIYNENDRLAMEMKLRQQLQGKPLDTGVDSSTLICKCAIEGLPKRSSPRLLYLKDYEKLETVPEYKQLTLFARYKLAFAVYVPIIYSTFLGKLYFNLNLLWSIILMKYCPYLAFFRFGIKNSLVNIFVESPLDDTKPKTNAEYDELYKKKGSSWKSGWLSYIW